METPRLNNQEEFKRKLRKDYANTYGLDFPHGIFKRINTNPLATGVPHLSNPVIGTGLLPTGIDSHSLNFVGRNSAFDGVIYGNTIPGDIDLNPDQIHDNRLNARTFGLKTPHFLVGFGYDIFGQPVPNFNQTWAASGVFGDPATNVPSGDVFLARKPNGESSGSLFGTDTSQSDWAAGPLDVRWDVHRKVWTGRYGIYPGLVTAVHIANEGNSTDPQFPSDITYDAIIYDGQSSGIYITGIRPNNERSDDWKVYATPVGNSCVIIHLPINGKPGFGMFTWEKDYATECSSGGGSSSNLLQAIYNGGEFEEGKTGYISYNQYDILIGNATGILEKRQLVAGTGIVLDLVSNTGLITFKLDPTINFTVASGVDFQITQLSGFIGPITITQGGTGATGKIFVDLTTNQAINGVKSFNSGIIIPSGLNTHPALLFNNGIMPAKYGFSFNRNDNVTVVSSGKNVAYFNPTGIRFTETIDIRVPEASYAPLTIWKPAAFYTPLFTTNLTEWKQNAPTGSLLGYVDTSGYAGFRGFRISTSGNSTESIVIHPPRPWTTGYELQIPSTGGTIALVDQINKPQYNFVKVSGYYSITNNDNIVYINTNATGCVVLLPNATNYGGRVFNIKDWAGLAETNNARIEATSSQLIDGTGRIIIDSNYASYTVTSDAINWYIL